MITGKIKSDPLLEINFGAHILETNSQRNESCFQVDIQNSTKECLHSPSNHSERSHIFQRTQFITSFQMKL